MYITIRFALKAPLQAFKNITFTYRFKTVLNIPK